METSDLLESVPRALVHLAYALRGLANNQASVLAAGRTVRDVIDSLERDFPGMRFHLCYETGELRPYVNIFLNRENIRYHQGLDTPLPYGAILHILPSVAGGTLSSVR
ncbi:MAG TPA: MoaD/ThiS family protein [Ktedonobacteraceae bacterium]|nr:MoaD/ThiS family protein [Ktedonobacteraceae bacterium]